MTDQLHNAKHRVSPSAFMRSLRPEYYSDSVDRTIYQLDSTTLDHHLETITARNETHGFEIFCRKLCERTICPNLKPATGPEGGGDSKADAETIPVADEISTLSYVGEPNAGKERWAFAFSAKKKWAEKIRSDVQGLVAIGRQYQKIYCVTARFARAKDRARLEDELTGQYGLPVTILDRTWIIDQVIDGDRKDLAFNYLGVGQEVQDASRLGPTDYSRTRQLEDIEKALADPERFKGMELQRVVEALVAAKLSRGLERPRIETDGRFARAIRLAGTDGTYRLRLEAKYESIWTAFWWFDDIALLNNSYDEFEKIAFETDHAANLEFLCNLAQLLFNVVIHDHMTASQVNLVERIRRLSHRLEKLASDRERPNNALEARLSLLVIQTNEALVKRDQTQLTALWPHFSALLDQAKGLGEFPAERLIQMVEACGNVANDPAYEHLVEQTANFVSERKSEAEGALVLLKRAKQLDFDERFEIIRLLGKAAYQLTKKEYTGSLIEATQLLAVAYRGAGLLWAARATCIFMLASMFMEAEDVTELPATVVPSLMLLAWIGVELRHLPEVFEAIRLVRGCIASLPLKDESKEHAESQLVEFDTVLASQIANFTVSQLGQVQALPDVLAGLGLHRSRTALLYMLGYEELLRERGAISPDDKPEDVAELFSLLASQPASDNFRNRVIFNEGGEVYESTVLGMRVAVRHEGTESATLIAEAVIGAIEALFATTLDLAAPPHTESFSVVIDERTEVSEPAYVMDADSMSAVVRWPADLFPAAYGQQDKVREMIVGLAGSIFVTTCAVEDVEATFTRFFRDDAVLHRIAMIVVAGNSRVRLLKSAVGRLSEWAKLVQTTYPPKAIRPTIVRRQLGRTEKEEDRAARKGVAHVPFHASDHRDLTVRSVIDNHLWNRAGWTGTVFADWGPPYPPAMAFAFRNAEAGKKIFERWRERFGEIDEQDDIYIAIVREVSAKDPAHYRVMVTSRLSPTEMALADRLSMVLCRIQTMEPKSDVNLTRFLEAYARERRYVLLPAHWKGNGPPELFTKLGIGKTELGVKRAPEISDGDIEAIALHQRDE